MKKRLLAALAVSGLMAIWPQAAGAAAATLVVDDDGMATVADCNATTPAYPTISLAVAAANPGDTIKVCPGLYNEQVTVTKDNLTLVGVQAGVGARTRPFVPIRRRNPSSSTPVALCSSRPTTSS